MLLLRSSRCPKNSLTVQHRYLNAVTLPAQKLTVVFPQGAGGHWLRDILESCITGKPWNTKRLHFHDTRRNIVNICHEITTTNCAISIDDPYCRFNFWRLYVTKTYLHEFPCTRTSIGRVPGILTDGLTSRDQFYWVLNQCRFLQSYKWNGLFNIHWSHLFTNPDSVWDTICKFLDYNNIPNLYTFSNFEIALNNYKNTCYKIKPKINFNNLHFLLWSVAFLQSCQIVPLFDLFENFRNTILKEWVYSHKSQIVAYTEARLFTLK